MSISGERREWVNRLIDRARRRLSGGDAASADRLAAEALVSAPQAERARLVRARALLRRNEPDEALRSLDAADWYAQGRPTSPADDPLIVPKLLTRASALTQLDRLDDAARVLRAVLSLRPGHRTATLRLAAMLIEAARFDEAIDLLCDYRRSAPDDRRATRLAADAMDQAGRYDEALQLVRMLSGWTVEQIQAAGGAVEGAAHNRSIHAGDPADRVVAGTADQRRRPSRRVLRRIARLAHRAGRIGEALDAYDLLVRGRFDESDTACGAAALAASIGDDGRVMRYLSVALRAEPGCATAGRALGRQHLRCGRFAAAGRVYWRLSRADETDAESAAGLIVAALCAGRMALADRLTAQYAARFTSPTRRSHLLAIWRSATPGRLLDSLRGPAGSPIEQDVIAVLVGDAAATLSRSIESKDRYADLHYHRAVCLEALGDPAGAAEALDAALAINAGYVDAAARRAATWLRADDAETALRVIDTAMQKRPDAAELAELRAAALALAGRMDAAMEAIAGLSSDAARTECADHAAGWLTGIGRGDLADQLRTRCPQERGWRMAMPTRAA